MRAGGPQGPGGPGGAGTVPAPPRVRLAELRGAGLVGATGPGERSGPPVQTWYLAVTAAVLLIACANVANLLLARGASRAHELAVRVSLGATGGRIARQLLVENAVLALLGGVAGLAVAAGVWRLLPTLIVMPPLPPLVEPRLLLVTAGIAALTVALVGLAPMLGLRHPDLRRMLGAAAPALAPRSRGRSALVVVQFAVSVVLLVAAGLFVRSFQNLRHLDLGFDRERLLLVTADTRGAGWTPERAVQFWTEARARIERLPGVRATSAMVGAPYLMRIMVPMRAEGEPPGAPGDIEPSGINYVDAGFFAATGVRIEEGRPFTPEDRSGSAPVAIVSRSFVRERFDDASPLGRCVYSAMDGSCLRVVGVAADARFGDLTDQSPSFVYQPLEQRPPMAPPAGVLNVRTTGDPAEVAAAVRRELRGAGAPQVEVRTIAELIAPQLTPWRASALLLGVFGALGLVLAAVGLYGVVAFLVARRTRELGIRVALGATRSRVLGLVLGDAGRLVGTGAAAGLLLAVLSTRFFQSMLFGVTALDPPVYLATTLLLAVVALAAALTPARRAARVDPMVALRTD